MVSIGLDAPDTGSKKKLSTAALRQASRRTARLTRPSAQDLDTEVARVDTAHKEGVSRRDLSASYQTLRATHLPLIVELYTQDPRGLSQACLNILHSIGSISPASGVAIENQHYVLATLPTFPIRNNPELAARRQALLQRVIRERLLLANTSFRVPEDKVATYGDGDGYRVSGSGAFIALAGKGDLLFFVVAIDGTEAAYFLPPLRKAPPRARSRKPGGSCAPSRTPTTGRWPSCAPKLSQIADAVNLACAANRTAAQAAEEIVAEARRTSALVSLLAGTPGADSAEVVFAPLVGEPLIVIDRRYGRLVLGEHDFTARRW